MTTTENKLEQIESQSIQDRARREPKAGLPILMRLATGSGLVSSWWSPRRDADLRAFWKQSDHLSGALSTLQHRIANTSFRVRARDESVRSHVRQADELTDALVSLSEYGDGWLTLVDKIIEDFSTTDNGFFVEVIGDGDKDGPIVGRPYGLAALDSYRCQRTGHAKYPVLYSDTDGKLYKLHRSRVMFRSAQPSAIAEMNGVGLCAISRAINTAQNLIDISVYKQEKLGSRPHRGILITRGGLSPDDVRLAFQAASTAMDTTALRRYSKLVAVGDEAIPDANADLIDLATLPDGFSEEVSTTFGMATIALAFGLDPREIWPTMSGSATRAEALLSHIKQRSRGPGYVLSILTALINQKFLPQHLYVEFDNQDDAQDEQAARMRNERSMTRERDVNARIIDERTARQQMLREGEITQAEFDALELNDGRLRDGSSVLALFYVDDDDYRALLDVRSHSTAELLDARDDKRESLISAVRQKIYDNSALLHEARVGRPLARDAQRKIRQANAALNAVVELHESDEPPMTNPTSRSTQLDANNRAQQSSRAQLQLSPQNPPSPRARNEGQPDQDADGGK